MKGMDSAFIEDTIQRLRKLEPDRTPAWGKLTAAELVPHLIGVIHHSMGDLPPLKFTGNWFTSTILPHIVYTGMVPPPRNLKVKSTAGEELPALSSPGNLDTLRETMDRFVKGVETGSLKNTAVHPLFGDVGPQGWAKIHVVHFRHHFKQFGV